MKTSGGTVCIQALLLLTALTLFPKMAYRRFSEACAYQKRDRTLADLRTLAHIIRLHDLQNLPLTGSSLGPVLSHRGGEFDYFSGNDYRVDTQRGVVYHLSEDADGDTESPTVDAVLSYRTKAKVRWLRPVPGACAGLSDLDGDHLVTLYRAIGPVDLDLLRRSDFARWPLKLRSQPFSFPVLSERYAFQIAEQWNVHYEGAGYVARFRVHSSLLQQNTIGSHPLSADIEWWSVPLDPTVLNDAVVGRVEVLAELTP